MGGRDPAQSLAGWVFLLHFSLFAGEVGHAILGAAGIALVLITLTGAWLWWPSIRRLAFGFTIRWSRPSFVVNYDFHRVIGIISLPLVFILALTGTILIFYDVGSRVVHALFLTTPAAAAPPGVPNVVYREGEFRLPLSLDEAARLAIRLAPSAQASSMYVPDVIDGPVKVWLRTAGDIRGRTSDRGMSGLIGRPAR